MNNCEKCKRPIITVQDFEKIAGKPYLIALADKNFLDKLREEVKKDGS